MISTSLRGIRCVVPRKHLHAHYSTVTASSCDSSSAFGVCCESGDGPLPSSDSALRSQFLKRKQNSLSVRTNSRRSYSSWRAAYMSTRLMSPSVDRFDVFRRLPCVSLDSVCLSAGAAGSRCVHVVQTQRTASTETNSGSASSVRNRSVGDGESARGDQSSDSKGTASKPGFWRRLRAYFTGKNAWKGGVVFFSIWCPFAAMTYISFMGAPEEDEHGQPIVDEFSQLPKWEQLFRRAQKGTELVRKRMKVVRALQPPFSAQSKKKKTMPHVHSTRLTSRKIADPTSQKLLPEPLKLPYKQPKYTVVIELRDVLLHPDWTMDTGWRFKRRPGAAYFLERCGMPNFELVVFTNESGTTAFPLIEQLDQEGHILYRLFRDSTRYQDGKHLKDLACLNRDLSKVIYIDCDREPASLQPDNAFIIPKWEGDSEDKQLFDLAAFLQSLASNNPDDVRDILAHYTLFDDPLTEFRNKQIQLQKERELSERMAAERKKSLAKFKPKGAF